MPTEKYDNIIRMSKREEREKIMGIIEFQISLLGDSSYEKYTIKTLRRLIEILEINR